MKYTSWDMVLTVGLLVTLFVFAAYSAAQQSPEPDYPTGSSYGAQPDGARALKLWLGELGYNTINLERGFFLPDDSVDMLLILSPSYLFTEVEAAAIERWVCAGGTLIYAEDGMYTNALLEQFDLDIEWLEQPAKTLSVTQPLLNALPLHSINTPVETVWKVGHENYVTHLQADGKPALLSLRCDQGWVFALSTLAPFTNAGLKDPDNATLVYNLALVGAGSSGKVAFDEFHHGFQSDRSIRAWLTGSRVGWAIVYSALLVFAFLLISGRRFGAALPLPEHTARRTSAETIRALANLNRRAGHRQALLKHYKDTLKRRLGRTCGVDPGLGDEAFVAELALRRPLADRQGLARLLTDLSRQSVSERDMVRLTMEATSQHWE